MTAQTQAQAVHVPERESNQPWRGAAVEPRLPTTDGQQLLQQIFLGVVTSIATVIAMEVFNNLRRMSDGRRPL